MNRRFVMAASVCCVVALGFELARGDKPSEVLKMADGKLTMPVPSDWTRQKPASRIVEHEFSIKAAEGDEEDARVTVMGAGGSVEANITRWLGQFKLANGSPVTLEQIKHDEKEIGGAKVHVVDIAGTYQHRAAPFAGGRVTPKKDYRMLGAIIVTPKSGQYFIKAIGPAGTIAGGEKAFQQMLTELKLAE